MDARLTAYLTERRYTSVSEFVRVAYLRFFDRPMPTGESLDHDVKLVECDKPIETWPQYLRSFVSTVLQQGSQ